MSETLTLRYSTQMMKGARGCVSQRCRGAHLSHLSSSFFNEGKNRDELLSLVRYVKSGKSLKSHEGVPSIIRWQIYRA
ncbi:hypothetical protein BO79DRAFT_212246, partial [Aspergillus costaricaensis CBS 115574]